MKTGLMLPAAVAVSACVAALPAAGGSATCWKSSKSERSFAAAVNESRGEEGRRVLRLDPELSRVARVQAAAMMREGSIFHNQKLGKRVTKWKTIGENVGRGTSTASLHSAFMRSETHRANILGNRFYNVGVGVKKDGDKMWVSVVFQGSKNPGTTYNMPSC